MEQVGDDEALEPDANEVWFRPSRIVGGAEGGEDTITVATLGRAKTDQILAA